ncbi:MAG TPA: TetR/AcrR family transcriptional regulator [Candidatus Angelobacter sp.]|nr:TetR/AcrR family transcriptional regulator [Candidatus Angelobacter sp.]
MSRTANKERPKELRAEILKYLVQHGLSDLSLRPLAKAVGCSPRVLLYYFGSKEKMVSAVLAEARQRQQAAYDKVETGSFAENCAIVWRRMSAADSEPLFRLFFEVYGIALRHPQRYKAFLHHTIEDWLRDIADPLGREGHSRAEARAFATLVVAGLRGFMLDYCATHDRGRIDRAVKSWLATLDSMLPERKGDYSK